MLVRVNDFEITSLGSSEEGFYRFRKKDDRFSLRYLKEWDEEKWTWKVVEGEISPEVEIIEKQEYVSNRLASIKISFQGILLLLDNRGTVTLL